VSAETDLGELLARSIELPEEPGVPFRPNQRAESYGGNALRASEQEREREREARLAKWRASLIDGPVLVLDLKAVTSGTFDPRRVFPFGDKQTVYTHRELIAEWGLLTVQDGAVLEDDGQGNAHVSLKGAADDHFSGAGWTLQLNEGWRIVPAERPGDFTIRQD
jgi:hypothetical protein